MSQIKDLCCLASTYALDWGRRGESGEVVIAFVGRVRRGLPRRRSVAVEWAVGSGSMQFFDDQGGKECVCAKEHQVVLILWANLLTVLGGLIA